MSLSKNPKYKLSGVDVHLDVFEEFQNLRTTLCIRNVSEKIKFIKRAGDEIKILKNYLFSPNIHSHVTPAYF